MEAGEYMAIKHHPDISTLMTCSAGATPEALCAVVVSHLSMCPECLKQMGKLEKIGVAMFSGLEPAEMEHEAPVPQARSLAFETHGAVRQRTQDVQVPAPLVERLGDRLDEINWETLWPGVEHYHVPLSPGAEGDLRLFRLAAGQSIPEHGHIGEELTIVLMGRCHDGTRELEVGDFSDLDDGDRHMVTARESGCLLLIASEGRPQFLDAERPAARRNA